MTDYMVTIYLPIVTFQIAAGALSAIRCILAGSATVGIAMITS